MTIATLKNIHWGQVSTWLLVLFICLATRLLGAIFYVEDIDSLRFALAVYNYDLYNLQPHFPGYFFYFMLIKPIFCITRSVGISFAIMGALASWLIVFYSYRLYALVFQQDLKTQYSLLSILLLINPLMFLMSTRYMPDIGGLALLVMGSYYLLHALQCSSIRSALIHVIILGLEGGLRLSYLPFFAPSILLLWRFPRHIFLLISGGMLALLFWFVPMLVDTGWSNLVEVCQRHIVGHFTEWGGTVMANNHSYWGRFVAMVESIWADGMGGFWGHRHWITLLWSLILLGLLANGRRAMLNQWKNGTLNKKHCVVLALCLLCYSIWAYFFQNIVYKPRHIMPLLPFLTMLIALGGQQWVQASKGKRQLLPFLVLGIGGFISSILIIQHKKPSSIAQVKKFVVEQSTQHPVLVLSPPLMNFYFEKHSGLKADNISCMPLNDFNPALLQQKSPELVILSLQNMDSILVQNGVEHHFYHNPYVNRLWSQLSLYSYNNSLTRATKNTPSIKTTIIDAK